jgi:hypothetical protein
MTSALSHSTGFIRRAVALLTAALYLTLCTLGALTHSHVPICGAARAVNACALHRSGHSGTSLNPRPGGPLADTTHCAYCEWQASSVSLSTGAARVAEPTLSARLPLTSGLNCFLSIAAMQPGSRAPPAFNL